MGPAVRTRHAAPHLVSSVIMHSIFQPLIQYGAPSRLLESPGMRESSRRIETRLARLTLAGLAVYAPLETMASWQMVGGVHVLVHPGFLQSLVAFGLLFWGSMRSLRARPRP